MSDRLVGLTAFAVGFEAGSFFDSSGAGLRSNYALMCGKTAKEGADFLVGASKKAKWEDKSVKIRELIQNGDPSAQSRYRDLFQCFFTKLGVHIFFAFEGLMTPWCEENNREAITIFEEFGKFAGKMCYVSCEKATCQEEAIKHFIDCSWYEKQGESIRAKLNLTSDIELAAQKLFIESTPAWCPNIKNYEGRVVVQKSVWEKNINYKLRSPFSFEQDILQKLFNDKDKDIGFKILQDSKSFCYEEHHDILEKLMLEIQCDETLNPEKALQHSLESCSKHTIEEVNSHMDQKSDQIRNEINEVKTIGQRVLTAVEQAPKPATSTRSPFSLVRKPCSSFTGRDKTLREVHDAMQARSQPKGPQSLVIITGAGGMGKTQTARKYADEHFKRFYSVIVCINAETLDALRDSFIEAEVATTKGNSKDPKDYPTEDRVASLANTVYIQLSKDYKQQNILMIFDNAIQMNSTSSGLGINKFLPNQKYDARFHVIVTSQSLNWTKPHNLMQLDKLNDTDAISLLESSFKQNLADDEIGPKLGTEFKNLQKSLDGYPLGISVAAADILDGLGQDTISQDDLTSKIQKYLTRFEASNEPLKFESESHESDYGKMMTKVLNLAISRIQKKQAAGNVPEKAIQLLHMMSYLSPDGIYKEDCFAVFYSQDWKLFSKNNDEVEKQRNELNECFQILKNMSLITLEERKHKYRGGSIQLHRLVQKLTREIFKENVDDLNCWFKPFPFVLYSSYTHATHALQNICSTFESNIPVVALASVYYEVLRRGDKSQLIGIHDRIKKLLQETEQPDTLQQDLQKFLYHIVCLWEDHLTSNVENVNTGHVTQVLEVMKTHVNDLWVQCIGIQAFERLRIDKRLFTQDEVKCVSDWINLFFDTRYPQYTNWMKQMHDKALYCSLELIALSHGDEGNLRSAEAYIKLANDTKHSMDDKIECWDSFRIKLKDLSGDFISLSSQGDDVTRISNVFLAAVDIFARKLARLDQDNHFYGFGATCSEIRRILKSAELARMFWSSWPFMEALLQRCFSSAKELEKIDALYEYTTLVTAAWTLMALFAEASDEDFNSHASMHDQMETVFPSALHRLRRLYHEDKDEFNDTFSWFMDDIPLHLVKRFLRKHGEKDVWFVQVSLAYLAPAQFFSENPAVRSQALQYALSKENFDSEDDSEDEDDDILDDEEDSESNEVSDEEEN